MKKILLFIMMFITMSLAGPGLADSASVTDTREEHPVSIDFKKAEENILRTIDVFDTNGKYLGTGSGYTVDDALRYAKLKHGLYLIKEKGKWTLIIK